MKIKNPIVFILFLIFLIVNIVDAVTGFFILKGEANPVYIFTGSFWLVCAWKFFIVGLVGLYVIKNKYPTNFWYYLIVITLCLGILLVSFGAYSNIYGINHPLTLQNASQLSEQIKVSMYIRTVQYLYILPLIISLIGFKLYDLSVGKAQIKKEYGALKEWWNDD